MDRLVRDYTVSLPCDRRLYKYDIAGSIAHARMLGRQGIISTEEAEQIIEALLSIQQEIENGEFDFNDDLEDIHMNIEACLTERLGETGAKLHTARSRNDQVALDLRLFTKDAIYNTIAAIKGLQHALLELAEANKSVVMPGYTHLQKAQPILFAHHCLAYFEMFQRDLERFGEALERTDVLPLGSGALAGVPYPIDREFVARELNFSRISGNSLDAVSDRDFVLDYLSAASLAMMHISRLAEEIVLWTTAEFDFVELDDSFATGSSIMPQKKNPDVAELARARTGRTYGHLMAALTMLKALPLSYNRDLQEDKEGLFDTVDTLLATLEVFAAMLSGLRIKEDNTRRAAEENYTLATDVADYLVGKGIPFRQAHSIVGSLVRYAIGIGQSLRNIELSDYRRFSPVFDNDVKAITLETSVETRSSHGGTSPQQVERALAAARQKLDEKQG
ncbi:MAG: argininosuccinate lyase [Dehalococcoidia bacterium]|nr:argininosuccinate lyase [Dehalococcoidia bacterium]